MAASSGPTTRRGILRWADLGGRGNRYPTQIEIVRNLERKLAVAIRSYSNNSQTWLILHSYIGKAQEELDAILQDVEIHPHTMHIMAPSSYLGLMVDKDMAGAPATQTAIRRFPPPQESRDQKDGVIQRARTLPRRRRTRIVRQSPSAPSFCGAEKKCEGAENRRRCSAPWRRACSLD